MQEETVTDPVEGEVQEEEVEGEGGEEEEEVVAVQVEGRRRGSWKW